MGSMASRTRTFWFFGLSCGLGLVVACGINSQPVPPGFGDNDSAGGKGSDAGQNEPTTGVDGGGTGGFADADAEADASDLDAGDACDASDDGGDAGDAGDGG